MAVDLDSLTETNTSITRASHGMAFCCQFASFILTVNSSAVIPYSPIILIRDVSRSNAPCDPHWASTRRMLNWLTIGIAQHFSHIPDRMRAATETMERALPFTV